MLQYQPLVSFSYLIIYDVLYYTIMTICSRHVTCYVHFKLKFTGWSIRLLALSLLLELCGSEVGWNRRHLLMRLSLCTIASSDLIPASHTVLVLSIASFMSLGACVTTLMKYT